MATAVLLAVAVLRPAAATETIRVRADPWMPFNGGTTETPGYVTEVLKAIFEAKGIMIQYGNLAWEKSLAGCRERTIDAVPCANKKEGDGLVFPDEPIGVIKYGIFTRKDSTWQLANDKSFETGRLAAVEGYSYWPKIDAYIAAHPDKITKLNPNEPSWDGVQRLQRGEIDLLPESPQVFFWTLRTHQIDAGAFRLAARMAGDPVYVVFSATPEGRRWANLFDSGLRELRTSGRLAAILGKYGVEDWK